MSWISNILGGSIGKIIEQGGNLIDSIHTSEEEKMEKKLQFEKLMYQQGTNIEETIRIELQAKERVLVAELNQSDNFTKRARPSVVYAGLLFILYNYCIAPSVGIGRLELPTEFWVAWGGIVSTWVIGRSAEKRGVKNKAVSLINGD